MRLIFLFCSSVFLSIWVSGQQDDCQLQKSTFDLSRIESSDLECIARQSSHPNTIFYTFARWCKPCLYHLPTFMSIAKHYDGDLYVLLIDPEGDKMVSFAKDYILEDFPGAKILILKDGVKKGKKNKYREFLKEVSPPNFDVIDSMSKYFVYNKQGELKLVTSYEDKKDDPDWRDSKPMVRRLVLPLLQKKEL